MCVEQKVCQNIANSKKRLEYVDLMKGICITLVVATHCGVCIPHYLPLGFEINMALINIRMSLYFFLSGIFFKEYMSFSDFVVRKVNKLIVPYVFFAIFPYALLFVIWPETIPQNTQGIYSVTPCYRTYEWHAVVFKSVVPNLSVVLRISSNFAFMARSGEIDGYAGSRITRIYGNRSWEQAFGKQYIESMDMAVEHTDGIYGFAILLLFLAICLLTAQPEVSFKELQLPNLPLIYIASLSGIMVIWLLAVAVNKLLFVSYCGRYSLIILGTQSFFFGVVKQYSNSVWVMFLVTMALAPVTIWIFKKYFPYFTAQKDLFPVGDKVLKRKE